MLSCLSNVNLDVFLFLLFVISIDLNVNSKMTDKNLIPNDILDDLSSRFIVNIPEEERDVPIRLCFQVEQAYWFYLDFFCAENSFLPSCGMKEFTTQIFNHIPFLTPLVRNIDGIIDEWRSYKLSVPTYGAIVLNEDLSKILLVQSYFARSSWGFPKGKINELESPANCAAREVLEETGLDISKLIKSQDYIESIINDQTIGLYIVGGINENIKFQPKTRNEIKSVEWFLIADLPSSKKEIASKTKTGVKPKSFFMILPFVKRIKQWVSEIKQDRQVVKKKRSRHKSVGEIPANYSPGSLQNITRNSAASGLRTLQDEIADFQALYQNSNTQQSSKENGRESRDKAQVKRQLFKEKECEDGKTLSPHQKIFNMNKTEVPFFIVPRWLSFKLDKTAILKCFDD